MKQFAEIGRKANEINNLARSKKIRETLFGGAVFSILRSRANFLDLVQMHFH